MDAKLIIIGLQLIALGSCNWFPCQNGATYDAVYDRCECSPYYFGYRCETSFASADLCRNVNKLPVIADPDGSHRPRAGSNLNKSTTWKSPLSALPMPSFTDSSEITAGWYRVQSPWGDRLVVGCGSGVRDSDCGGRAAYVLHDVTAEETTNMALFKARAFRVWSELKSCRLVDETFYPVRLLKCSESLTLYFLLPLPRTHSYCIGDESDPSDDGLAKMIFAKEPILQLLYDNNGNGEFHCSVFGLLDSNANSNNFYTVAFILTRGGQAKPIQACNRSRQVIPPHCSGNCTFVCLWSDFALQKTNIYGSTLECRIHLESFSAATISSNVYSFTFRYNFTNGFDTIRPGEPVRLCINSWNIPASEKITFSVAVARRITYKKDRIDIAALIDDENNTLPCNLETAYQTFGSGSHRKERQVCAKLVLHNEDHEGKVVFGLNTTEQLSFVKINISYKSSANGLYTYSPSGTPGFLKIDSLNLRVDLRSLVSDPQSYLHIFSDPFVKPVGGNYAANSTYELKANRSESVSYIAMQHKLLPYDVQILITRPQSAEDIVDATVVTRVAVRYGRNIITISGNANEKNGELSHTVDCKASKHSKPQSVDEIRRESECDVARNGIKIESTPDVVRVQFLFYGTIIYVWKFRTHFAASNLQRSAASNCAHSFIMSQREMKNSACSGNTHRVGDEFVLDLTVIPSMYDYKGNVEGLMYAQDVLEAGKFKIRKSTESLFSDKYTVRNPHINSNSLVNQPNEIMKICKCGSNELSTRSKGCLVDVTDVRRTRREILESATAAREQSNDENGATPQVFETSAVRKQISSTEAQQFCEEYLSVQMVERNYSISICTGHSDHPFGADYTAQFEYLCVRYALTLGTYEFAETLLNSMLDTCRKDLGYNATEVRSNSPVLKDLERDMCPNNNCGANGICLAGACSCNSGYSGRGCENRTEELEAFPTIISTSNQNFVCASGNCSSTLLLVSPLLKSTEADCHIKIINSATDETTKQSWKIPAAYATGCVMVCNLSEVHNWLREKNRLYVVIEMSLAAATWNSSNRVKRLIVQSLCSGRPTQCHAVEKTMADQVAYGWSCVNNGSASIGSNDCHQGDDEIEGKRLRLLLLILVFVPALTMLLHYIIRLPSKGISKVDKQLLLTGNRISSDLARLLQLKSAKRTNGRAGRDHNATMSASETLI